MKSLVAAVALAAVVAATASAGSAQQPPTRAQGVLLVALSLPSTGFQAGAVRGSNVVAARGFEIDLARALAGRLAIRRVRFQNVRKFAQIYGPGRKGWDLALAQVSITAARRQNVDFSVPYMEAGQGVLVRKYLTPVPRTLAALRTLRLCAVRGTTGAEAVARSIRPAKAPILTFDQDVLLEQVRVGRCDAAVYDAPSLAAERALAPQRYGALAGRLAATESYGAVFERGSPLRASVDSALRGLLADGIVARLAKRWLAVDISKLPVIR